MDELVSNSILLSIKKQLNIDKTFTAFDNDIILLINSAFATLNQLGVGPEEGYYITSESNTWDEFIVDSRLTFVKQYIWICVRILFDPPTGSVLTAFEHLRDEFAWRIKIAGDDLSRERSV